MKKIMMLFLIGMFVLPVISFSAPVVQTQTEDDDFSDIEQTLKRDQSDNTSSRISNLEQEVRYLNDRLRDLERTVYDLKSRV